MQSVRQYRRLGRQLRDSHVSKTGDPEKSLEPPGISPAENDGNTNGNEGISRTDSAETNITLAEMVNSIPNQEGNGNDLYLVKFDSNEDRDNPLNWSTTRKWTTTGIVGCTGFVVGWASSIDSAALRQATVDFGVSSVVEALAGTGIYLIAFGFGSLMSGPFSETFGRNPVYIVTLSLFAMFIMASALSPNIGAQIAFRFLAGFFGCTPLTNFGGSVADMWSPLDRTYVFPVCACLSFWGPFLAPMVGAFIGQSDAITWRWTEWVTLIMTGLLLSAIVLFVPETYAPTILKWKAQHIRAITGDDRYKAESERDGAGMVARLRRNVCRPFQMLAKEMMVLLFSIYLSAVYIVLFTFLTGYDFIFGEIYGFSQGNEGLTWIAVNIGFLIALSFVPFIHTQYKRRHLQAQRQRKTVEPEQRLWYAML